MPALKAPALALMQPGGRRLPQSHMTSRCVKGFTPSGYAAVIPVITVITKAARLKTPNILLATVSFLVTVYSSHGKHHEERKPDEAVVN